VSEAVSKSGVSIDMQSASKRKRRRRIIVVVLVVVLVALILIFVRHAKNASADAKGNDANPALTVSVTQASRANWDDKLSLNGALTAWQEAVVSAEVSGLRISGVLVDVGSEVKRGQPLALLSQDTVLADLHKQEASVAQARASLAEAAANADRARKIRDSGALSEQQINQYLTAEETGKANLAAAVAQLDSENIRVKQTSINAVDDGVISSRTATLGAVVSAGTELFRLVRQGRVEWRAEVSAPQLSLVRPGQKASVSLPDGNSVIGAVRMTSPTLDANSRNALVYVDVPSRNGVRAGMYARGEIFIGKRAAMTLPQACVVQRDGRTYIFELGQNAHVIQHVVTTGRRVGDSVEIVDGLPQGASVVATGAAFLNDGDLVRVVSAAEAASANSAPLATPAAPAPDATAQSGAR
jgi:RND family efflux transporter MFP subunit